jgi:hypothetical protein
MKRLDWTVIPGMNAIAFTREVRALARLEGWMQGRCLWPILRGSPKGLAPQDDGGDCGGACGGNCGCGECAGNGGGGRSGRGGSRQAPALRPAIIQ